MSFEFMSIPEDAEIHYEPSCNDDVSSRDHYSIRATCTFYSSTNDTASNLPGPGRLLGNAYSYAGRRLERVVGVVAHKAGFGPNAVYQKIQELNKIGWRNDEKKRTSFFTFPFAL